jgi:hypothetical protein
VAHVTLPAESRLVQVVCLAGDAPGDCVYVTGPTIGQALQVARCDLSVWAKMPAVGVLVTKTSPTAGVVVLSGIYRPAAAVTPNALLWVGAAGGLVTVRPAAPAFLQTVGIALANNIVNIQPSTNVVRVI